MKKLYQAVLIILACTASGAAFADSVVDEVWNCKLNDGKEIEDVQAANAEWIAHVNGATDVGEITSATAEAIVGDHDGFYFVDRYPNLAAYAAVKDYVDSDAGKAAMKSIDDKFEDLFDCTSNKLFKFTPN